MVNRTLKKLVSVNTNYDEDVFVGIKCINNNVSVNFPLGFRISDEDKGIKEDIQLLLKTLLNNTDQKESQHTKITNEFESQNEPIQSYMYIIQDYLSNGLYKEKEVSYQQNNKGKINWGKTIKTQNPMVNEGSVFYLDLVTKKNKIKEDDLITQIHQYCVQTSFSKIWWLYLDHNPIRDHVKLQAKLFKSILIEKISNTFNDNSRLLFEHMLAIIKHQSNDDSYDFRYGTYKFEHIWEKLIDKVFGIDDKQEYFPNTQWIVNGKHYNNHVLMPDTIMIKNNNVFVIDAKYYKYGVTGEKAHLPGTASVTKQIAYGEYVATQNTFKEKHGNKFKVYNAFIIPYSKTEKDTGVLEYCGYAVSDWKQNNKEYERIQGIMMDVKDLMLLQGESNRQVVDGLEKMILKHSICQ